ncbi:MULTISPECIES: hypothetical protein [unclassified Dietzia]|uniref:hypothetical protein n=1 Tax=unclassified Dietzia TaxID=2617939 RepID=UPI000D20C165|nr:MULTISPECIES: hypothetical protein [unclassified Dietzia]AVZ40805.1 hypothetical protein CT688_16365 [Dietzia sp. JS16-p6b]QGW26408.1 hypothetical protein GJR88_05176 [Dietzia sp. DQ12-45-1b]
MNAVSRLLLGLLVFNGVTAAGGGLALMVGVIPDEPSWIEHTDFPTVYFAGVILLAIVGGSALFAATALLKRSPGWQAASLLSGWIMVVWIAAEIASIRGFHFLQVVYVVTGVAVIWCTPTAPSSTTSPPASVSPAARQRSSETGG